MQITEIQYQAILAEVTEIQYLIIASGGMATKTKVEGVLMARHDLSRSDAHSFLNTAESQNKRAFHISKSGTTWTAQRPEPQLEDYPELGSTTAAHEYLFLNRPPSIATHPDGATETEAWTPRRKYTHPVFGEQEYLGIVTYATPLDPEQLWKYELLPVDPVEWAEYEWWEENYSDLPDGQLQKRYQSFSRTDLEALAEDGNMKAKATLILLDAAETQAIADD